MYFWIILVLVIIVILVIWINTSNRTKTTIIHPTPHYDQGKHTITIDRSSDHDKYDIFKTVLDIVPSTEDGVVSKGSSEPGESQVLIGTHISNGDTGKVTISLDGHFVDSKQVCVVATTKNNATETFVVSTALVPSMYTVGATVTDTSIILDTLHFYFTAPPGSKITLLDTNTPPAPLIFCGDPLILPCVTASATLLFCGNPAGPACVFNQINTYGPATSFGAFNCENNASVINCIQDVESCEFCDVTKNTGDTGALPPTTSDVSNVTIDINGLPVGTKFFIRVDSTNLVSCGIPCDIGGF